MRLNIPPTRSNLEDFVSSRAQAEVFARRQSKREDITLSEIWSVLAERMQWNQGESLCWHELSAEDRAIIPVDSMRQRIEEARRRNVRIIFVSDMYLPKSFIQTQLRKYEMARPSDTIYVSGEVGLRKGSGSLFKYVLRAEGVKPSEICFEGDNIDSDYKVPKRLGIRARHFKEAILSGAEREMLRDRIPASCSSEIAGAMRAFRVGSHLNIPKGVIGITSQFIGPFVMGFAIWVLRRAQEKKLQRVFFISRDCQLTWKVACELAPMFGGIDCRYLQVSRQALVLPLLDELSRGGMSRLLGEDSSLVIILARLELDYADIANHLPKIGGPYGPDFRLSKAMDWDWFWRILNEEPLRTKIVGLMARRRAAAKSYFSACGLFDDVSCAIVDLGWALTIQSALEELLRSFGRTTPIHGLYLGLVQFRSSQKWEGNSEALIYECQPDLPIKSRNQVIFKERVMMEHIIGSADHPSVHHYDFLEVGEAVPVYFPLNEDDVVRFSQAVHPEVINFVLQNANRSEIFCDEEACREVLTTLATEFFEHPTKLNTSPLLGLMVASSQSGSDRCAIIRPRTVLWLLLWFTPRCRPFKSMLKDRSCLWEKGSLVHSPKWIQLASRLVAAGRRLADMIRRVCGRRLLRHYHSLRATLRQVRSDLR